MYVPGCTAFQLFETNQAVSHRNTITGWKPAEYTVLEVVKAMVPKVPGVTISVTSEIALIQRTAVVAALHIDDVLPACRHTC